MTKQKIDNTKENRQCRLSGEGDETFSQKVIE